MEEQIKRKFYWRKLDDQAKVFALASNKKYSSTFRLSVILKEMIEVEKLQMALELALDKYQVFKVKMKKGLFWYYFEENEKKPIVNIENEYPFQKINTKQNNNFLFKVTYFKNKINIDFFHALTDGNGGGKFLKEIIYRYLELKYPNEIEKSSTNLDKIVFDSENAYTYNYQKYIKKSNLIKRAYKIKGNKLPRKITAINHFNIDLKEIKDCARMKECSISMFLVAMLAYSIYETNYIKNNGKYPINIAVPINLKKYFESDTISNFFSYMVITLKFKRNLKYSFDDILKIVKREFKNKLKLEKIVATISKDAGSTNKFFIRIVPLAMKKIAVRIGSLLVKRKFTMTFSNIGNFEVEDKYKKYIENFLLILGPDWAERIKCGVCSYENNLVVSFGTNLKDSFVEKEFKNLLKENNIKFEIQGNGVNII